MSDRPSAATLLGTPGAMLSRSHLRDLGLERRAVDAVFRELCEGSGAAVVTSREVASICDLYRSARPAKVRSCRFGLHPLSRLRCVGPPADARIVVPGGFCARRSQ